MGTKIITWLKIFIIHRLAGELTVVGQLNQFELQVEPKQEILQSAN